MKLNNDFTYYLSADTLQAIAQNLHDNSNFHGLCEDEIKMLQMCKDAYLNLRDTEIPLIYNCPA